VPRGQPALFAAALAIFWAIVLVAESPMVRVHGLVGDADVSARFTKDTPVALAAWAADHEVRGRLFNTMEWGSYLAWRLPETRLFVDVRIWIFPEDVWSDFLRVSNGLEGWEEILDRRQVEWAILDRRFDRELIPRMSVSSRWEQVYADDNGLIFRRR
jgi:hypothetical protein